MGDGAQANVMIEIDAPLSELDALINKVRSMHDTVTTVEIEKRPLKIELVSSPSHHAEASTPIPTADATDQDAAVLPPVVNGVHSKTGPLKHQILTDGSPTCSTNWDGSGHHTFVDYRVPAPKTPHDELQVMQLAAISTAALGYAPPLGEIHPDYVTPALKDVIELRSKYQLLLDADNRMYAAEVPAARTNLAPGEVSDVDRLQKTANNLQAEVERQRKLIIDLTNKRSSDHAYIMELTNERDVLRNQVEQDREYVRQLRKHLESPNVATPQQQVEAIYEQSEIESKLAAYEALSDHIHESATELGWNQRNLYSPIGYLINRAKQACRVSTNTPKNPLIDG
jgi:hypothetical protein